MKIPSILLTDEFVKYVYHWMENEYSNSDINKILSAPWPNFLKTAPNVVYRGEGLNIDQLGKIRTGHISPSGSSWSESLRVAQNFAHDAVGECRVVFRLQPTPSDVVVNLKLLGQVPEFYNKITEIYPHLEQEGIRSVEEQEILLRKDVKLTLDNAYQAVVPNERPPKWKKFR